MEILIGGQQRLIISNSIYFRYDYPICVESHLIMHSEAGYRHNLIYFDKKKKEQKIQGKRIERNTYMHLRARKKVPLLVVNAFMGGNKTDPKVSGRFDIFFANKICFIVGTHQGAASKMEGYIDNRPAGDSACLLWRRDIVPKEERAPCRVAFNKFCRKFQGYRFTYTKEACGVANNPNE
ncbi:uncharacterized protein LOC142591291 isoform X2 [Dermacentor variabilis]|uniref:uncharacterized protein LOC142591291 isoform X2 n=1 Tax=Dermacentor variabilis TaxID=34621 RepID=UPI003F5BAE07